MDFVSTRGIYPLADMPTPQETCGEPFTTMKHNWRAVYIKEKRSPKKGEWYLSGSPVEAYRAPNDLTQPFHIARLVRVEIQTVIKIIE